MPKETLLIAHTIAPPKLADCNRGTNLLFGWGHKSHVTVLNAAWRHLARKHGMHLVDIELMAADRHHDGNLRDQHHPKRHILFSVVNIILNLVVAARTDRGT